VEIDQDIRSLAAGYTEPTLSSLDAIHLATAEFLNQRSDGGLSHFVSYDKRLLDAVDAAGLPTASPGQL
jgi:hypothetical protein